MTYSDVMIKRLQGLCKKKGMTVNKLAAGLDMTVSQLLDFPEMNETVFDDE